MLNLHGELAPQIRPLSHGYCHTFTSDNTLYNDHLLIAILSSLITCAPMLYYLNITAKGEHLRFYNNQDIN